MSIYLVLDIVALAIIALFVWQGMRTGLVKTVCQVLTYVGAVICAKLFSPYLSTWLDNKFMNNLVYNKIKDVLSGIDVSGSVEDIKTGLSEKLSGLSQVFNFNLDNIAEDAIAKQENVIENVTGNVSSSISLGISNILAFVIVFVLAFVVLRLVSMVLDGIASLPILNTINKAGGLVTGTIKGVFVCWLLVQIGVWSISMIAPETNFNVEHTQIVNFFYKILPLNFLK